MVREIVPSGYSLESDNDVEKEVKKGNTTSFDFKNKKLEEKFGSLKVHKRIERKNGKVDADLGNGEFTITLTGPEGPNSEVRTLVINKNGNTGDHVTFENLPYGTYYLEETDIDHEGKSYDGYRIQVSGNQNAQDVGSKVIINKKGQEQRWLVNKEKPHEQKGKITVTKIVVDKKGKVIEDNTVFKFKLEQKVNGKWVEVEGKSPFYITGNDTITIDGLPFGEYRVTEIDVPDGFEVTPKDGTKVELSKKHSEKSVTFTNKQKQPPPIIGSISVTKYVYENEELINDDTVFTFVLYKLVEGEWIEIDSIIVEGGSSGSFNNLPKGEYKVFEEDIPVGYTLISENGQPVEIKTNEQISYLDFDNEKDQPWEGTIRIIKSIKDRPNDSLAGFKFELWKDGEKVAGPLSTDLYGKVDFDGLAAGTYEIKEVSNGEYTPSFPDGSMIEIGPDVPNENDIVYEVNVVNEKKVWNKGKIILSKTKLGLPNKWGFRAPESPKDIVFTLEGENLEEPLEATTNGLGFASFDNLMEGTYILKEVVPEGYESSLPEEGLEIKIEDKLFKRIVTVTVINKKIPDWKGKLIIQKEIRIGEILPTMNIMAMPDLSGFEFELWLGDEKVAGPLATDSEGKVTFYDLAPGTYTIIETESKGLLPGGPFTVEVNKETADKKNTVKITFINYEIPLEDIVVKKIVSNDSDLSGFTFRLYRIVEGEEIFVEAKTTDESGLVVFEDQPDGEYVIYEDVREGYHMGIGAVGSGEGKEFYHSNNMIYPIEVENRKLPPPTGEIDVSKRVVNKNNQVIEDDSTVFTFRLYKLVEDGWEEVLSESPFTITGNGTVTIDDLPLGKYKVVEVPIPSGYQLITDNNVEVALDEEILEVKAEFTNRKDDIPPPPSGKIRVTKTVLNRGGNISSGNNTRFYFELRMRVEGSWILIDEGSIVGNGSLVFDDLEDGEYSIREINIDDDYRLISDNNIRVEIVEGSEEEVEFINRRRPGDRDRDPDPDPDPDPDEPETPPVVVIEEEVPQAPPEVPEVLEEVEIVEEPVPEVKPVAVLPKTGSADPILISALGGMLLGLGLFLKKKED